jgi:hypothetical protein
MSESDVLRFPTHNDEEDIGTSIYCNVTKRVLILLT